MQPTFCEKKWLINDTDQVMIRRCSCCESVHVRIGSTTLSFTSDAFTDLAKVFTGAAHRVSTESSRPKLPIVQMAAPKSRQ